MGGEEDLFHSCWLSIWPSTTMAYPPAASLLREYFQATNWSDNHYHNLTLPSRNLLDFAVPPGLNLALSHRPLPTFNSTLTLSTLAPSSNPLTSSSDANSGGGGGGGSSSSSSHNREVLAGQLTYVATSVPLVKKSTRRGATGDERISVPDAVQSFRVPAWPLKPELRDDAREYWYRGQQIIEKGETTYTCARVLVTNRIWLPPLCLFHSLTHLPLSRLRLSTLRQAVRSLSPSRRPLCQATFTHISDPGLVNHSPLSSADASADVGRTG